ncbi:beta-lactamase family protein [Streptomyces sp. NBC_00984]|uniref:serine hydrolase n=1 Tax=Streptomyces sp. NBC_00984 TaxID=2903700 RepID=UPI003866CDAE|nr:beta-lactamase family protein [Streptomyces sp. NBC_00984]
MTTSRRHSCGWRRAKNLSGTTYTPDELLKTAMSLPPGPAAKDLAVYSNTNYILLGMLIEKVTGHPAPEEITTRIIDRLGLKETAQYALRGPSCVRRAPTVLVHDAARRSFHGTADSRAVNHNPAITRWTGRPGH